MRIACVYWWTPSVGGIATHLNTLRAAAIREGDAFDILHSKAWKRKSPCVFGGRKWVAGGDTKIWVDGEVPQNAEGAKFLEDNYDAVLYGFICPHRAKGYPEPAFRPLYDVDLPKAAWVMDGYWDEYADWAEPLLPRLRAVFCPQENYAIPLRRSVASLGPVKARSGERLGGSGRKGSAAVGPPIDGKRGPSGVPRVVISPFPFLPPRGPAAPRAKRPLLVWPNQWKEIKGLSRFLRAVPDIDPGVDVELYSCGIRYYQLRTTDLWRDAVGEDKFLGFHGDGRAPYFGNVDLPVIHMALQRAWFTVNLQGITARKETYKSGSYNNTEVEALWFGALPILHTSAAGTPIPENLYYVVKGGEEIPDAIRDAIGTGYALDPDRQAAARDFVRERHMAGPRYLELRRELE